MKTKAKNTKIKKTVNLKKLEKKLGMGLSSLLSKDAELSSVIKAKISEKVKQNENFGVKRPSLGVSSKNDKINLKDIEGSDNIQRMLPIQNLVSKVSTKKKTLI